MRRVLVIPGWYTNPRGVGGGNFFAEQARVMRAAGWDMAIAYADLRPAYWGKPQWTYTEEPMGVKTLRYQGFAWPKRNRWTIRRWQRAYLQAVERLFDHGAAPPELVHAQSYLGALAAAAVKERWGIPYLVTEHLGRFSWPDWRAPSRQRLALRLGYAEARGRYAVSEGLAQAAAKLTGFPFAGVLPNMIDTNFFRPADKDEMNDEDFTLISIGDPWHTKGLDLLIEAVGRAQQSTQRRLVLRLGDKIPKRQALTPVIERWRLERQVHFLGWLNREEVRHWLRRSHVYVSASRYESFGITMVEALACGLPVIATRTAGAQDIVRPGKDGLLVERESAEQLSQAILRMMSDKPNYASTILHAGAKARFSYGAVVPLVSEAYEKVGP